MYRNHMRGILPPAVNHYISPAHDLRNRAFSSKGGILMTNEELNGIRKEIIDDAYGDLMLQYIQKPSALRTERDELFYKINQHFFGINGYRLSKETRDKICSINDDTSLEKLQELYTRCEIEISLPYKNNEKLDKVMKSALMASRMVGAAYYYTKKYNKN